MSMPLAPEIQKLVDATRHLTARIPRGDTPLQKAASSGARSWVYDPVKMAAKVAKQKATLAMPGAPGAHAKTRPRQHGRWLPDPPVSKTEYMRRYNAHAAEVKANRHQANKARFEDAAFKTRVQEQLAKAREVEYARRRRVSGTRACEHQPELKNAERYFPPYTQTV